MMITAETEVATGAWFEVYVTDAGRGRGSVGEVVGVVRRAMLPDPGEAQAWGVAWRPTTGQNGRSSVAVPFAVVGEVLPEAPLVPPSGGLTTVGMGRVWGGDEGRLPLPDRPAQAEPSEGATGGAAAGSGRAAQTWARLRAWWISPCPWRLGR